MQSKLTLNDVASESLPTCCRRVGLLQRLLREGSVFHISHSPEPLDALNTYNPDMPDSALSQLATNVRFLLWAERIPSEHWFQELKMRVGGDWSDEEIRQLLEGQNSTFRNISTLASAFNISDEELTQSDLLKEKEVDILEKNVEYLLSILPKGGKSEMAGELKVAATTISRWSSKATRPPRSTQQSLISYFGLDPETDLEKTPVFLSPEPLTTIERKRWISKQVDALSRTRLRQLYPALRQLLK